MAKFQIFQALFSAAQGYHDANKPHLEWTMYALVLAGGINSVISLFYYLKVLKVMILERTLEEVESRPVEAKPAPVLQAVYATALALVVLGLGIRWNELAVASSEKGIDGFRAAPVEPKAKKAPKGPEGRRLMMDAGSLATPAPAGVDGRPFAVAICLPGLAVVRG